MNYDFKNVWSNHKVAFLQLSTFVGFDGSACHYYGSLNIRNSKTAETESFRLSYKLTDETTRKFNDLDDGDTYEKGWDSQRFWDVDSVYEEAIRIAEINNIVVVLDSKIGNLDCARVIYCVDDKIKDEANELYYASEKLDEDDWGARDECITMFENVIKKVTT